MYVGVNIEGLVEFLSKISILGRDLKFSVKALSVSKYQTCAWTIFVVSHHMTTFMDLMKFIADFKWCADMARGALCGRFL